MAVQYYPPLAHLIYHVKAKEMQQSPAKHWCFTWNDQDGVFSNEDIARFLASSCDYLVFQEEKGENGTKHYQGYAEFLKPQRLSSLQKLTAPHRPHWEKRRGSRDQARDYAMKEDTRVNGPWEPVKPYAKEGQRGKRRDLEAIAKMVRDGHTDEEIFDAHPGACLQYIGQVQKVRHIFKPVRTQDLKVVLLYGPPGAGKTKRFWDQFPAGWSVPVGKDLWFTGYQGQPDVLIDDFAGNIGLTQLLQILDRYVVSLPTKGSHVWWCPHNIVMTTNCHPCNWYDYSTRQDSYKALQRRFHHVFLCNEGEEEKETDVSNFFNFQKVAGKHCTDITNQ